MKETLPDQTDSAKSAITEHNSAELQAAAMAADIAARLNAAIHQRGRAAVAFSGGSTPALMFSALAKESVDWANVHVTLVDERCVDVDDERSNARLLQEKFLHVLPVSAKFYPLYVHGESYGDCLLRMQEFPQPFDVVHLGMGEDAHTASFFPDAENIAELLDPVAEQPVMSAVSLSSREPRLTWSLSALSHARCILLQLRGNQKRVVLERVLGELGEDAYLNTHSALRTELPVLAMLMTTTLYRADGVPATIYYAGS